MLKEILYIVAIALPIYGLLAFTLVATWHYIQKRRNRFALSDGVQVSSDGGKTWAFLPHDSVREGWILDPTIIAPDNHSPMCDIRKGKKCSCGYQRGAYMN